MIWEKITKVIYHTIFFNHNNRHNNCHNNRHNNRLLQYICHIVEHNNRLRNL